MTEEFFIKYVTEAADTGAQLMDAGEGVFEVGPVPMDAVRYNDSFYFGEKRIGLGLRKHVAPSFLLDAFIDVTIERIRSNSFPMEAGPNGLFVPSVDGPCTPRQWGEDLYRDVQNRLIQSFSLGLSLEFELINSLSAQRYEGASCSGGIVFESDEGANVNNRLSMSIQAADVIAFKKDMLRQIRKLLAGTGGDFLVFHRQGQHYVCKGYCSESTSAQFQWKVRFTDVLDWEFCHYGTPLFRFLQNDPKVIRDPIAPVLEALEGEFGPSFNAARARILLQCGSEQSHGTALIFLDFGNKHIKDWINRLYRNKRTIRLTSCQSMGDAVRRLSGMDGALLINAHTMEVEYFTTIVDGHAVVEGDLARGARHNGILTFVSDLIKSSPYRSSRLAAVVFSEDGGAVTICGKNFRNFWW